jgi:stage II sporulation protein P
MRRNNGLQKALYLVMMILGGYILYKAGKIWLDSRSVQEVLDRGIIQRELEDRAVRTYAPGYAAVIAGADGSNQAADSLREIAPIYSYLAEGQAGADEAIKNDGEPGTEGELETPCETDVQVWSDIETNMDTEMPDQSANTAETDSGEQDAETGLSQNTEDLEQEALSRNISAELLDQMADFSSLITNFYTVDEGTVADEILLDAGTLLAEDLTIDKDPEVPQILIYHTHSQEAFADSREGEVADTIVGMGSILAEELQQTYGYQVIHDTGVYDLVDGILDRSAAYDYARTSLEEILAQNPTLEVIIDLHRDGVEGQKFVTEIDGRPTSMIMFFNGISRDSSDQPITYLENPYTIQNLAFSLQLQIKARQQYPGFTRNIYLKAERFNLHLRPRSLLIEAGTQLNTVQEEQNAMYPLADLIDQVLQEGSGM